MNEHPSFAPGLGVAQRRAALIGRSRELRELEDALQAVRRTGRARIVTLIGAAGIGKTRLLRDFVVKARAQVDPPRAFRGATKSDGAAFDVFARLLRARFSIVEGMDEEASKAQVRAQLATVLVDRKVGDVAYFIGQLLDLEFADSPLIRAVKNDASEMRILERAVIKSFIEADASRNVEEGAAPLVLLFDDLHAAHDESLGMLAYLLEHTQAPVLFVCASRGDLLVRREDWPERGGDRHQVLELSPLSATETAAVMRDLLAPCGDVPEVETLIDAGATLAGGNPAMLEQMVRLFLDSGVIEAHDDLTGAEAWSVHLDRLDEVRLPMTVHGAVEARIAALAPPERTLLAHAAIMGGVFWLGGLIAIERRRNNAPEVWRASDHSDVDAVRAALEELVERDYILRLPDSTFLGDEEYAFKHNLEREALAKLTTASDLREHHRAVADWLGFKEHARLYEEHVATLARHREKAGELAQAALAYFDAADIARAHYASARASDHYVRGFALLDGGAEVDADRRLSALHDHGDVLQSLGKNDEALRVFHQMLTRAFRLDLRGKGGVAHGRIGRIYRDTGRLELASTHLNAALALFEAAADERGVASTVDDIGKLHWIRGDYAHALEFTQRALATRRKLGDRRSIALSLNNLGLVYQDSGQFKQALDAFEQALRIRREIGDLVGVSVSLNNLGTVAQDQRDDARALSFFQEAYDVAKETGDRNRIAVIVTNIGETLYRLGDAATAVTFLKRAEGLADELGDKLALAEAARGLGKAYLKQREYIKARECTARAVEIFREIQSKVQLGIALRSLGEVEAAGSAGGDGLRSARASLLQSIVIFENIGNDVELARSCRAYAELLRATPEAETDVAIQEEAREYAERADAIAARFRGAR